MCLLPYRMYIAHTHIFIWKWLRKHCGLRVLNSWNYMDQGSVNTSCLVTYFLYSPFSFDFCPKWRRFIFSAEPTGLELRATDWEGKYCETDNWYIDVHYLSIGFVDNERNMSGFGRGKGQCFALLIYFIDLFCKNVLRHKTDAILDGRDISLHLRGTFMFAGLALTNIPLR